MLVYIIFEGCNQARIACQDFLDSLQNHYNAFVRYQSRDKMSFHNRELALHCSLTMIVGVVNYLIYILTLINF